MKLRRWTPEDTQVGRELLNEAFIQKSGAKLEEFYAWMQANVSIEMPVLREIMDRVHKHEDTERALRLYDAALKNYNPIRQTVGKLIGLSVVLIILFGALGGIGYLWNMLFG